MTLGKKLWFFWADFKNHLVLYSFKIATTICLAIILFVIRVSALGLDLKTEYTKFHIIGFIIAVIAYFVLSLIYRYIELSKSVDSMYQSAKDNLVKQLKEAFDNKVNSNARFRLRLYEESGGFNKHLMKVTVNKGKKKNPSTKFKVDKQSLDLCEGVVGKAWFQAHSYTNKSASVVSRDEEVTEELITNKDKLNKVKTQYNMSEEAIRKRFKLKKGDEYLFPKRMAGYGYKLTNGKVFVLMFDISNQWKDSKLPKKKDLNHIFQTHSRALAALLDS